MSVLFVVCVALSELRSWDSNASGCHVTDVGTFLTELLSTQIPTTTAAGMQLEYFSLLMLPIKSMVLLKLVCQHLRLTITCARSLASISGVSNKLGE